MSGTSDGPSIESIRDLLQRVDVAGRDAEVLLDRLVEGAARLSGYAAATRARGIDTPEDVLPLLVEASALQTELVTQLVRAIATTNLALSRLSRRAVDADVAELEDRAGES